MKTSWWVRFSVLLVLIAASVIVLLPTVMKFDENGHYPVKSKINLGLDLQGGLYMVLGIDFKKVYRDEVQTYVRKIETLMRDQEIGMTIGSMDDADVNDPKQSFTLNKASDMDAAKKKIKEMFGNTIRITQEDGARLQIGLAHSVKTSIEEQSVGKSIEVIRNRIDEFGVTEPEIIAQGVDRIVVQLPGVRDIERAKELIGKTAKLEFKIVNDTVPPATLQTWMEKSKAAGITYKKGERFSDYIKKMNEFLAKDLPEGHELAFEKSSTHDESLNIPYVIEATPRITGDDLADARVQIDPQKNQPYVSMEFKSSGSKRFEDTTGANIGKRMAVVLDGNVYSAPMIQAKIAGGHAQITLGGGANFNKVMSEARDLALILRAGALPVQLDFLEQRTVGPNLGNDSIQSAKFASIVGCILVFIFAVVYYRFSGVIAIVTLLLNVLFTVAILVAMEATLTLPGIAGIALTVGMAIDTNIIIFEKIRDEIRKGLSSFKAYEMGFDSALWTILDAHITQAAAGFCLLNFGTGPIRGFAVTLLVGIAVTVYTAYYVSHILYELYMEKTGTKALSI
ncbi:protein translocase subunit SecD [Bacteriovorax sp. PP10]|uniref:Protein translocase subunit SecD n=1 Tax=Bacteriovorax antarcticus TaxID=3088717 RepID=A0ABU5VZS2_9BACT|nr:protein translocase subunit SecD [Bacteriovorax sp. PP10]MEA9358501.1 protein translocase subunit SecD [Bacteriovorax sp. PP10]